MADPYESNITADDAAAFDRSMPPKALNMATRVRQLRVDLDAMRVVATLDLPGGNAAGQAGVLNSNPQTVIAAVPGSTIIVEQVTATLEYQGVTYDGSGDLALEYDGGAAITADIPFAQLGGAAADATRISGPSFPYEPSAGAAVVVTTTADWYTAAGDGSLAIDVVYRLVEAD